MHVGGPRYSWPGRIYGPARSVDPRRGGIRAGIQHLFEIIFYSDHKVPQPNTAGEGILGLLAIIPRIAIVIDHATSPRSNNACWK